jgi:hypothetical protein
MVRTSLPERNGGVGGLVGAKFFLRRGGVGESRFDFGGVVGEEGKKF